VSYQEDAEYFDHQRQLVENERERRKDTGFVTDTSKYPWIEEGDVPVTTATYSRFENIRAIQNYCADVAERKEYADDDKQWTEEDGAHVASLLNKDPDPWDLFRYMDEKTGSSDVGYRTQDGREWFYVLRQMRNTVGSGLFENMTPRYP
jgi:hypothetical protein